MNTLRSFTHGRHTARLLALGLVIVAASGLQDGAMSRLFVPAPANSDFPLTARDSPAAVNSYLAAGRLRASLGGLASRILDLPTSTSAAIQLAAVASEAGLESWLDGFTRAARRRVRTSASEILAAEVALAGGDHETALTLVNRALAGRPRDPNVLVLRALLLARSGDLPRAFAELERARPTRSERSRGAVGTPDRITLSRSARLVLSVNPTASMLQTRALLALPGPAIAVADARSLIAVSHHVAGHSAHAVAMLRHAQARAARHGMRPALASAVSLRLEASESGGETGNPSEWRASCRLTHNAGSDVHNECLIAAVGGLWRAGSLGQAVVALDRFRSGDFTGSRPFLDARVASSAAPLLLALGRLEDAVEILEPGIEAATTLRQPDLEAHLRLQASMATRRLEEVEGARAEPRHATEVGPEVSSELRDRVGWEASLLELQRLGAGRGRDLAAVTRSLAAGLEHDRSGDLAEAARLYERTLNDLRAWHSEEIPGLQWSVRDAYENLLARHVHTLLQMGRIEDGLLALETGRARPGVVVRDETLKRSRASLVPGTAALVYVAAENSVWVWIVTHDLVDVVRLAATAREIEERARLWQAAAVGGLPRATLRRAARALVDHAVQPVLSHPFLRDTAIIAVAPHPSLHRVSFSAVVETALGEGHPARRVEWSRIPSLSYLASRRGSRSERSFRLVAGVGQTSDTVGELAVVWQSSTAPGVKSYRATEALIRKVSPRLSLLHLAAHSEEGTRGSAEPGVVLLPGPGDDGVLHFSEITSLPLSGTDVVLTGCGTAGRPSSPHRYGPISSPSSLAEAFLIAGARSVIGSLWSLSERDGRLVAAEIYRAGGPMAGPGVLRIARRELARRVPDRPWVWSGLVWFGAPPDEVPPITPAGS